MPREYLTEKCETTGLLGGKVEVEALRTSLNQRGAHGWERVSAFNTTQAPYGETREIVLIFKRPTAPSF